MRIHSGTDKNIYFKIFSFGCIVCSCEGESTNEDKVRVFYTSEAMVIKYMIT